MLHNNVYLVLLSISINISLWLFHINTLNLQIVNFICSSLLNFEVNFLDHPFSASEKVGLLRVSFTSCRFWADSFTILKGVFYLLSSSFCWKVYTFDWLAFMRILLAFGFFFFFNVCVHVCVQENVNMQVEAWGQPWVSSSEMLSLSSKERSLIGLELTN